MWEKGGKEKEERSRDLGKNMMGSAVVLRRGALWVTSVCLLGGVDAWCGVGIEVP